MPATQEISESLIRENIKRAVADVFKTMLGRPAELCVVSQPADGNWSPVVQMEGDGSLPQVIGTVGFLGDANGLIYFYLDLPFARLVTCHMLGMTEAELEAAGEEVINDAIGELTNMTVGSFKNGISDAGFPCKLTIPTILRGSNFTIEPIADVQRYVYKFKSAGQHIVTDVMLKVGD
jgi:chemotaxis protein CheX